MKIEYDPDNLGCVMLGCDPWPDSLREVIPESVWYREGDQYGPEDEPHVTLLYGLLTPAYEQPVAITKALAGWNAPSTLYFNGFRVFSTPEWDCVVGELSDGDGVLADAHRRLSKLPHIDTHLPYTPHVTLGYVLPGLGSLILPALSLAYREYFNRWGVLRWATTELNLGKDLREGTP